MDRISMKYILKPLSCYETGELIKFRLRQAGMIDQGNLFSHEAIQRIFEYTSGYPRQISRICHNAMERIAVDAQEVVTGSLIENIIHQEQLWN